MVKYQVIGGCIHVCVFLPYFVSVLAVLCVCVVLNNEDVLRGAHERVCATACVWLCVSCV